MASFQDKPTKGLMGVYLIKNRVTGLCYVGASTSIHSRWQKHIGNLNLGMSHNPELQKQWDEHGPTAFDFSILEIVDTPSTLSEREVHWIKKLGATSELINRHNAKEERTLVSVHRSVKARLQDMNPKSINEAIKALLDHFDNSKI